MKLLVCGDRNWTDRKLIYDYLKYDLPYHSSLTIISGMARGADTIAAEWAIEKNVPLMKFPANWKEYGKSAGPIRNREMLKKGNPDMVLAFHDNINASKGTKDMVTISIEALIPTVVIGHGLDNTVRFNC